MVITIRHKVIGAIILSMIVIASLGWVSYSFLRNAIATSQLTNRSQQVLLLVEKVSAVLGDIRFELDAANTAGAHVNTNLMEEEILLNQHILALDSLLKDGPSHGWSKEFRASVSNAFQQLQSSNLNTTFIRQLFDPATALLHRLQQEENLTRRERLAILTEQYHRLINTSVTLLFAWLAIMIALVYILVKNLQARDIAEKKLKVASNENLDLYENAPCGYCTINQDGMIVNVNKTLLSWLGYTRKEAVDRLHVEDLLYKEEVFLIDNILLRGAKAEGSLELEMMRKDQTPLPVAVQYSLHSAIKGGWHLRCSVTDNTIRKKNERDIQQVNRELEAFSYSVSHDLRAPLRSINGYAQILREDYGDRIDEEGRRVIGIIVNNGKKMGQLIDDLLAFSRTGRQDIIHASIPMDDWVENLALELIGHEQGRDIRLKVHPLEPLTGDVSLIRQVWINLLSNAVKYTRKREIAEIEVGCESNEDEIAYYVKDNGAGFNMNYYSKLFGVFQRLHKDEDFEGTGVGLALVKRIIERHDGKIWAEAKPDEGATFYFSIPRTRRSLQLAGDVIKSND